MKNLLRIFFLTLMLMLGSFGVEAAWEPVGDDLVLIEVSAGSEFAGKCVTFNVVAPGKLSEDSEGLDDTESIEVIVSREQDFLDENGSYSYLFGISGNSGRYTAYITVEGMDEYITEEIDFVNMTQFKTAISAINENFDSYKKIGEIIDENAASFGLASDEYENFRELKAEGVAEIFVSMSGDEKLVPENREDILNALKKAIFVQSLNEGKNVDVFGQLSLSELDNSAIKDWYNKEFVIETLREEMTARLKNQDFKGYDEYKEKLTEAFVLATVRFPNGYKNLKSVAKAFEDEIGIDYSDSVSVDVWSELCGKDFDDFEEFCTAYKKLKSDKSSGGSSSGGSGGSGSSKHTSKAPMYTNIPQEKPTEEITEKTMIFSDVQQGHWAYDAVYGLYNAGIVAGRGDKTFEPDSLITREEFVKLISCCIDDEANAKDIEFLDVQKNAWYYEYIKKAYNSGIVSGYSDEIFGVGDFITRQDMAVIACRVLKKTTADVLQNTNQKFTDDTLIADYARESVYALRETGVISGTPENEFLPTGFATRAQAVKIIYNLLYK